MRQKSILVMALFISIVFLSSPFLNLSLGTNAVEARTYWRTHSPAPKPTPTPTPPPATGSSITLPSAFLPFTGLGGDYDYSYSGGDPSVMWTTWGQTVNGVYHSYIDWATTALPGYSISRLAFKFPNSGTAEGYASYLDYATLNTVLALFDARGGKVVLQNFDFTNTFWTTATFWNDWLALATHYRGDTRIAAFAIYNEMSGSLHNGHTSAYIVQYWADLTRAIHAIDPNRVVVFPTGQLDYADAATWIHDVKATGIQNEPNVVFDIVHPYYFGGDYAWMNGGMTVSQKVGWYVDNWIAPCVSAFGADRCWAGETFMWNNSSEQHDWLVGIINAYSAAGIGFDVYCAFEPGLQDTVNAIKAANYP